MRFFNLIGLIIALCVTTAVFAESAPVYDADTLQQQFENSSDQGEGLPPPPAPEQERAFVPTVPQSSHQEGVQAEPVLEPKAVPPPTSNPLTLSVSQRISQMEQQIDNLQTNGSAAKVDSLQKELQSLRGELEQLTHQIQQLQTQQKSMYTDLDKKLQQGTKTSASNTDFALDDTIPSRKSTVRQSKPAETTSSDQVALDDQPNVAEEQQVYQTAYNLIKAKKYNEAINSLQNMLQKYPTGQFAANAHYWLGDLYNVMGKNDRALDEFISVTKNYPDSPRVSDAQLKVGLIYASQSKWSDAKAAFKKVVNRYPGTASSRLANEQLKQIKQAGH